jgi:nucleoside-diphosphate-sugar epimerase
MERATANVIQAARRAGATILFPGNVFGLGRQTAGPLAETAPNMPSSRKGAVRVQMEQALSRAASESGPRVIVLRAGDFFGPTVRNRAVDLIFRNAVKGRPMRILGRAEIPHQWAYAPDLARLGLALLDMDHGLAPFEVVHFKGYVAWPMEDFLRQVARHAGHPELAHKTTPWPLLYLAGALHPAVMELLEIRYLWKESVVIDDVRRRQLLPDFRTTRIDAAIEATLESYRAEELKP